MKKLKLRYILIIIASLLCLGATFFALQAPQQEASLSSDLPTVSEKLENAVSMIGDSLKTPDQLGD